MSNGLVLGKFAPFHKGHQLLVDRSLAENDLTYIVIYDCPEVTDIPLLTRVNWIKKIYQNRPIHIVEAWNADNTVSHDPKIMKKHEKYLRKLLKGIKIDNFYSSEFYGDHVSKALKANDVRVDEARQIVPISATKIRENTYKYRKYLDPIVYESMIIKCLFLGAPSTGKSTLCKALAKTYKTKWVPEYGRGYWARNNKNRRLTTDQLDIIADAHHTIVTNMLKDANDFLFVDTDASTTRHFCEYYHGTSTPFLDHLTERSKNFYDIVFVCDDDIPYDNTEDRSGEGHREMFQKRIISDLQSRGIPYIMLWGSLNMRMLGVHLSLVSHSRRNAL